MLEVRWSSWFWSTLRIVSLFKLPAKINIYTMITFHTAQTGSPLSFAETKSLVWDQIIKQKSLRLSLKQMQMQQIRHEWRRSIITATDRTLKIFFSAFVKLGDKMLVWLSVCSEVQIVCIWSSWCHCCPQTPSSLASFKSRLAVPSRYRLTQVVLEKRPLNGRSSSAENYWPMLSGRHSSWFCDSRRSVREDRLPISSGSFVSLFSDRSSWDSLFNPPISCIAHTHTATLWTPPVPPLGLTPQIPSTDSMYSPDLLYRFPGLTQQIPRTYSTDSLDLLHEFHIIRHPLSTSSIYNDPQHPPCSTLCLTVPN